jgi:putative addiction module component (TIGR02574 family)
MSPTAALLFEQALDLSDDERAELIVRLLDTMGPVEPGLRDRDDSGGASIEAAWMQEARRRLSDIEAGRVSAVPWSEARERIVAREP